MAYAVPHYPATLGQGMITRSNCSVCPEGDCYAFVSFDVRLFIDVATFAYSPARAESQPVSVDMPGMRINHNGALEA
jgi:hypothetical protein